MASSPLHRARRRCGLRGQRTRSRCGSSAPSARAAARRRPTSATWRSRARQLQAQVSTFAGSGTTGSVDGSRTAASFYLPCTAWSSTRAATCSCPDTATNLVRRSRPLAMSRLCGRWRRRYFAERQRHCSLVLGRCPVLRWTPRAMPMLAESAPTASQDPRPQADVTTIAASGAIGLARWPRHLCHVQAPCVGGHGRRRQHLCARIHRRRCPQDHACRGRHHAGRLGHGRLRRRHRGRGIF